MSYISMPSVQNDIKNQEEHHRHKTDKKELIELLNRAGIEYDPRYLE